MNKPAAVILANAIIWAAVILAIASQLKGTDLMPRILPVLAGGAGGSLIVTGSLVSRKSRC